jgi:hypothetical protein
VLDTARRLRDPRAIQGLLAEAVQGGRCTPDQLLEELDAGSQRGTALVRAALVDVVSGARSVAEADALQLWRRTGLPEAQWNVALTTPTGQLIAVPDVWLPEVGLAWEIDSYDYHFKRRDYARTLDRNARYSAHGIAYLQTIPSRLTGDRENVIVELQNAYADALRVLPLSASAGDPVPITGRRTPSCHDGALRGRRTAGGVGCLPVRRGRGRCRRGCRAR